VSNWTGSAWIVATRNKFVYDGWNLVAELNATNNAVIRRFVWGTDLSGSMQGAGGVGGLLALNDAANGFHFAGFDGNGNVAGLVNGLNATLSAVYEYGPFGEMIRATGVAASNPLRFSSRYLDIESDLLYYGHRFYATAVGRWQSRDPIAESGGRNLIALDGNDAVGFVDVLGLYKDASGCSSGEISKIQAAERAAKAAVETAITIPRDEYTVQRLLGRFPNFNAKWLTSTDFRADYYEWYRWTQSNLKQILAGFDENAYGVECECWCTGDKYAYVRPGASWDDDIHFCPRFFRDTPTNRGKHFLHEASHLFADTEDHALGGMRPWVLNADDAEWYGAMAAKGPATVFSEFIGLFSTLYP
jgi:RHS repeat-associated protein